MNKTRNHKKDLGWVVHHIAMIVNESVTLVRDLNESKLMLRTYIIFAFIIDWINKKSLLIQSHALKCFLHGNMKMRKYETWNLNVSRSQDNNAVG